MRTAAIDLWLAGWLVLATSVGGVVVSGASMDRTLTRPPLNGKPVSVACLKGSCWIRFQGEAVVRPIPEGRRIEARMEDEVLTLGAMSQMVVSLPDQEGETTLSETAIFRVSKGEKDIAAESEEELAEKSESAVAGLVEIAPKSALSFVGELPISLVSPKLDSTFVASSFPLSVTLAFEVPQDSNAKPEDLEDLKQWRMIRYTDGLSEDLPDQPTFDLRVQPNTARSVLAHFGTIIVKEPGDYALYPSRRADLRARPSVRFKVRAPSELGDQINSLIENMETNPEGQVEVQTK